MRKLLLGLVFSLLLLVGSLSAVQAIPTCQDPKDTNCAQVDTSRPSQSNSWLKGVCYTEETIYIGSISKEVKVATLQGFGCIFRNILQLIVPLLGLALFVLLLVGGFQYMTAGGDPKQTQKATGTITAAVIGIVVAVGVWFIFQILGAITGINLLNFIIPG